MNDAPQAPQQIFDTVSRVAVLLDIVRTVVAELHPDAQAPAVIGLDATLGRDLEPAFHMTPPIDITILPKVSGLPGEAHP